jgi:hypothetical protein
MAVITVGCALGAIEWWMSGSQWALLLAAWGVAVGSSITCITRLLAISRQLRSR